jgi:hypothetical protein
MMHHECSSLTCDACDIGFELADVILIREVNDVHAGGRDLRIVLIELLFLLCESAHESENVSACTTIEYIRECIRECTCASSAHKYGIDDALGVKRTSANLFCFSIEVCRAAKAVVLPVTESCVSVYT